MADAIAMNQAKTTYETLLRCLDAHKLHYDRNDEKFSVSFGMSGDDIPMNFRIFADPERNVLRLISTVPFKIPEDKRIETAAAISVINDTLVIGAFGFDVTDGHLYFRVTNSYVDSILGEETITYMLSAAIALVEKYNDKLMLLGKGLLSLEEFLKNEQN